MNRPRGRMMVEFYAHSVEGKPVSEWYHLHHHLLNVASLTGKFAGEFNSGYWEYLAGFGMTWGSL